MKSWLAWLWIGAVGLTGCASDTASSETTATTSPSPVIPVQDSSSAPVMSGYLDTSYTAHVK